VFAQNSEAKTPCKPIAVLELTGALRKDPQRRRTDPAARGVHSAILRSISRGEQTQVWHELKAVCPPGVLTAADRLAVEIASVLMLRFRKQGVHVRRGDLNQLVSVLSRRGMSPLRTDYGSASSMQRNSPLARFDPLSSKIGWGCHSVYGGWRLLFRSFSERSGPYEEGVQWVA
jgi:hypothetical protein